MWNEAVGLMLPPSVNLYKEALSFTTSLWLQIFFFAITTIYTYTYQVGFNIIPSITLLPYLNMRFILYLSINISFYLYLDPSQKTILKWYWNNQFNPFVLSFLLLLLLQLAILMKKKTHFLSLISVWISFNKDAEVYFYTN